MNLPNMMMIVGRKFEELIARIAQKSKGRRYHLIWRLQRPSVGRYYRFDKANIPTRMAFSSVLKNRFSTILDQGADSVIG